MLQGGKRVSEIGVIYPFESLAGWFRFEHPDNPRQGFFVSPQTDYLEISGLLSNEIRRDFTFIHPEYFLDDKYEIENGSVKLNNAENRQAYSTLMLTGCNMISYKTLEKIRDFYLSGGLVIATTQLPFKSSEMGQDQKVIDLIKEIFGINTLAQNPSMDYVNSNEQGGKAYFFPMSTRAKISGALSERPADVRFDPAPVLTPDFGKFSYIHKVKGGKDIYYFANSTNENIDTEVWLRGNLELENWNPHNGEIHIMQSSSSKVHDEDQYTKYQLKLEPVSSTFWVGQRND